MSLMNTKDEGNDNELRLKRIFPDCFERYNVPPDKARDEIIEVYRACKTNKLERESFLSTYEECGCESTLEEAKKDPSFFSMSVYEKPKDVRRFAITNENIRPPLKIAKGLTLPEFGKVLRTKEYKEGYKKSSHIDWWLYQGAEPYKSFELIEDFKEYLESRKRGVENEGNF